MTARMYDNESNPYRRIVISFLIAIVAVVALILYYTLPRADILLETKAENKMTETDLLASTEAGQGDINVSILSAEQTKTKNFKSHGTGAKEDKASGQISIINDNSAAQSLVINTRFLSTDNVLFRLTKAVTVPAKSKISAEVIADQAGAGAEIGPTKFSIPGLNASLRSKIYGESTEPMMRREKPGAQILASDIDDARKQLTEELEKELLASLREKLPADKKTLTVVYQTDATNPASSQNAGAQVSAFDYTIKVKVTAIFYDPTALREATLTKLNKNPDADKEVLRLDEQSAAVTVKNVSTDEISATLTTKYLAQIYWQDLSQVINKDELYGMTIDDVKNYFTNYPGVANVDITLWPFWVKTVPQISDHINIKVK